MRSPLLALIIITVLPLSVAADVSSQDLVRVQKTSTAINWQPASPAESYSLRITGPEDFLFERQFDSRAMLSFRPTDVGGDLVDGSYTYEIRISRTDTIRRTDDGDYRSPTEADDSRSHVQSGSFTILNGSIVPGDLQEDSAALIKTQAATAPGDVSLMDFVINDDLIVTGSTCVGFDCVNGETFGFDTIKLKENNLRLTFIDTSTGAFPAGDWQIRANDSENGGANFLSIDWLGTNANIGNAPVTTPFRVDGAAPTNAFRVASTGRVGLRTATPVLDLHVATSDTPGFRLEQTSAGGFTAQTWDIAGNEANFFIRDVTGGSRLPFRIRPGAPTSSIDIRANGNVGIGTASPSSSLHVTRSDGSTKLRIQETSATVSQRQILELINNGDPRMRFENTNSGQTWIMGDLGGEFRVNLVGSPVSEFRIAGGGHVTIAGNLDVGGTLTKGAGAFKIDHPLDPANKYLYHSFVESPDMLNIYNGNVTLDEEGEASVEMPGWFEALNREFRYQLTPIGQAAPGLHVAERLEDNRFKIAGGTPGGEVSWQVTGVRHDPYAVAHRIPTEENKPLAERGTYLFRGYETEAEKRTAEILEEEDPARVVAAKNAEIRDLELENEKLQTQLSTILKRLSALEAAVTQDTDSSPAIVPAALPATSRK